MKLSPGTSLLLDGLRVISAEAVVVGHCLAIFGLWPGLSQNLAVVVFFILSGFLIVATILRRRERPGGYSFEEYLIDRSARIFTAFIPCVALMAVTDFVASIWMGDRFYYGFATGWGALAGNLLMMQDHPVPIILERLGLAGIQQFGSYGSNRPLWTVAVEWWMYLAAGWLLLAPRRAQRRGIWPILGLLAMLVPTYGLLFGRGDGLTAIWILGAVSYVVIARGPEIRVPTWALCGGAVGLGLLGIGRAVIVGDPYDVLAGVLLVGAFGSAVAGCQRVAAAPPQRLAAGVGWAAGYSFTLYLIHYPVLYYLSPLLGRWSATQLTLLGLALSNLLAIALAALFERRYHGVAAYLKRFLAIDAPPTGDRGAS